jgi:hypothetical protein
VVQIDQTRSRITIAHQPGSRARVAGHDDDVSGDFSQQLQGIKAGDRVDSSSTCTATLAVIDRIQKIGWAGPKPGVGS